MPEFLLKVGLSTIEDGLRLQIFGISWCPSSYSRKLVARCGWRSIGDEVTWTREIIKFAHLSGWALFMDELHALEI